MNSWAMDGGRVPSLPLISRTGCGNQRMFTIAHTGDRWHVHHAKAENDENACGAAVRVTYGGLMERLRSTSPKVSTRSKRRMDGGVSLGIRSAGDLWYLDSALSAPGPETLP